jgi:hypothetical protein
MSHQFAKVSNNEVLLQFVRDALRYAARDSFIEAGGLHERFSKRESVNYGWCPPGT